MVAVSHPTGTAPGGVTAGIDIGTTSVKAVAVDGSGRVLARARIPHRLGVPGPGCLEHDAAEAWVSGPRAALAEVSAARPSAVAVSALTPSMTAVDLHGSPLGCGVLYDDERGRGGGGGGDPLASGEASALLSWAAQAHPAAAGYWPAQAVANRALGGPGCVDYSHACSLGRLFDGSSWSSDVDDRRLPEVRVFGEAIGTVDPLWCGVASPAPLLVAGGVDALCEQLVAGADRPGDVLVVLGSTLVVWANVEGWPEVPGLWTMPHIGSGKAVVGGASNAGGLFVDWVDRLVAPAAGAASPGRVPLWWPYLRGERVPIHDPDRRAALAALDLTVGPAEVRRAALEASGFAVRHILEAASACGGGRLVVTGGGVRSRAWVQAIADVVGRTVEPVAVPEGAALGAAWLARVGAGLEASVEGASSWAAPGTPVDPDPQWVGPVAERYARYRSSIVEGGALHVR